MKITQFLKLSLVIISMGFLSACSSDDDSSSNTNQPGDRVLHIEKSDGSLFEDGEVITFNEIGSNDIRLDNGKLKFFLKNVGNENINVKIEVKEIRGTDGSLFTFCVQPLCIFNVTEGESYPQNGTVIAPGQVNSDDDYFINNDAGDESTVSIEYDLRFYVVDDEGNQFDDLTITYQFLPN
ncbi:MAG: hypothetical protein LAT51_00115 [Flavobacteriaceae bacterium]|nr:hypothetical protein [Flavobacteriaceae bacterium]